MALIVGLAAFAGALAAQHCLLHPLPNLLLGLAALDGADRARLAADSALGVHCELQLLLGAATAHTSVASARACLHGNPHPTE